MLLPSLRCLHRPRTVVRASYTAFHAFTRDKWPAAVRAYPKPREALAAIARAWKSLDAADRAPFEAMARAMSADRAADIKSGAVRPSRKQPPALRTTGYLLFTRERYEALRADDTAQAKSVIFRTIASQWHALSADEQERYAARAEIQNAAFDCLR